jgi:hypothetical protein
MKRYFLAYAMLCVSGKFLRNILQFLEVKQREVYQGTQRSEVVYLKRSFTNKNGKR